MKNSNELISKRFLVRKSLIGKNQVIKVEFKNGKTFKYNHDLNKLECFSKYKSYTSSTSIPVILRDKEVI